jgi:hypothetical protein
LCAATYAWPRIWAAARRLSPSESTLEIGSTAIGPPPEVRFMICSPICSKRFMIRVRVSSSVSSATLGRSTNIGPMAEAPTM